MTSRVVQYAVILWAGILLAVAAYWGLFGITDGDYNGYYSMAYSLLFCIGAVAGLTNRKSRAAVFLGLAQLAWAAASFMWSFGVVVMRMEVPFPWWSDIGYFIFPFLSVTGCVLLMVQFGAKVKFGDIAVAVMMVVLWYGMVFWMFLQPEMNLNQPGVAIFLNFFYPLGDALGFAAALLLYKAVGKGRPFVKYIMLGMMCMAIGDLLFSYRQSREIFWNGDVSDLAFMLSGFATTLGLLQFTGIRGEAKK